MVRSFSAQEVARPPPCEEGSKHSQLVKHPKHQKILVTIYILHVTVCSLGANREERLHGTIHPPPNTTLPGLSTIQEHLFVRTTGASREHMLRSGSKNLRWTGQRAPHKESAEKMHSSMKVPTVDAKPAGQETLSTVTLNQHGVLAWAFSSPAKYVMFPLRQRPPPIVLSA